MHCILEQYFECLLEWLRYTAPATSLQFWVVSVRGRSRITYDIIINSRIVVGAHRNNPRRQPFTYIRMECAAYTLLYQLSVICCVVLLDLYAYNVQTHYSSIIQFDSLCVCAIERNYIYLFMNLHICGATIFHKCNGGF